MTEPTTEAGRALLRDFRTQPIDEANMRDAILAIEAAAVEAERAWILDPERVRQWFHDSEEICEHDWPEEQDWPCGIMRDHFIRDAAVLAAIDGEAKTPEWRDDSGHWIGGNVGMPEAAIDDEAKDVPQGYEPLAEELFVPKRCANCGVHYPRHAAFCKVAAIDDEAKG